jgi:stress-induced-phosphoprotein 1
MKKFLVNFWYLFTEYHKAMESYQAGLAIEPENSLCKEGLATTMRHINSGGGNADDMKERQQHALADPEIQMILRDPSIQQVLNDMQENPKHAQRAMADPVISAKLQKLIAAGILQVK